MAETAKKWSSNVINNYDSFIKRAINWNKEKPQRVWYSLPHIFMRASMTQIYDVSGAQTTMTLLLYLEIDEIDSKESNMVSFF